ncbi:hypothetical protein CL618_03850 [archaeon]|nr:hypothetical protein [archaeon]|tara:strand:+ start:138 stop:1397 length:1260 start_codon:yes stop_codon:yes gene_type:complete
MKFTNNKEADKEIKKQLDLIVGEIKKRVDVVSIILAGGFGKGEGSFEIKDGKILPLNDYDIYIITKKKINEKILYEIEEESWEKTGLKPYDEFRTTTTQLDTFSIDLKNLTVKDLENLPPLLKIYELKRCSSILDGKDAREYIPDFGIKDIPLSDGVRFLLNRISYNFQTFSPSYFNGIPDNGKTMIYGCVKARLEIVTALLLLLGEMPLTHEERFERFKEVYEDKFNELYKKIPDLVEKVKEGVDLKLKLEVNKDPIEYWFETREIILEVLDYYLKNVFDVKSLKEFYFDFPKKYLRPYVGFVLGKKKLKSLSGLGIKVMPLYFNYLYFKRLKKYHSLKYSKVLFNRVMPDMFVYLGGILLYKSVEENGEVNDNVFKAYRAIKNIYPVRFSNDKKILFDNCRKSNGDACRIFFGQKMI